jgi:hypothetical protein
MRRFAAAAIAAVALSVGGAGAAVAHPGPWHWSVQKVMQRIDGKRVRVAGRVVRVDSDTALCSGEGRGGRQRPIRVWKHFSCTYSVFVAGDGIYDCEFRVHVLGRRKFLITNAQWTSGAP